MKKLIKPTAYAEYEPIECTVEFSSDYGCIFHGQPITLHFGTEFTYKFLDWFRQEYPESEFIKKLIEEGFFDVQPEEDYQADQIVKL